MTEYQQIEAFMMQIVNSAFKFIDNKNVAVIPRIECFARTFCGIAPWANKPEESKRIAYQLLHIGLSLLPKGGMSNKQYLVEAAYLCMGFLRAPDLWHTVGSHYQNLFIDFISQAKLIHAQNNNWVLFPAMIETFEMVYLSTGNINIVGSALAQMENWYAGDGFYKDGPDFQMDYYNSYVIHPMIMEIVSQWMNPPNTIDFGYTIYAKRARRYAIYLENLISPEATFPIMGRSSVYRYAAFAHLSDMLRRGMLEEDFSIGARTALSNVIVRMHPYTLNSEAMLELDILKNKF